MTNANPLPAEALANLEQWVADPEVAAWLAASNWKEAFARYHYLDIQTPPPFAPLRKPLAESTVAVITSGGLYHQATQTPFDAANVYGDSSIRTFPIDTPFAELRIAHDHYDHTVPEQDQHTINPAQNLIALQQAGEIGAVYPTQISFSGYIPKWNKVLDELVPAVLAELSGKRIDGVLLVPV